MHIYGRLFEAIRIKNYREAYNFTQIILSYKNDSEVLMYSKILLEIINKIDKNYEEKNKLEFNKISLNLYKELIWIVKNNQIISEDVLNTLISKLDLLYNTYLDYNVDPTIISFIYDIINLILYCQENNIDENYFNIIADSNLNANENLYNCLSNGDYISSIDILANRNFKYELNDFPFHYLKLVKLLLNILYNNLNKTYKIEYEQNGDILNLSYFKELIENEKFDEALDFYLNNKAVIDNHELEIDVVSLLLTIKSANKVRTKKCLNIRHFFNLILLIRI